MSCAQRRLTTSSLSQAPHPRARERVVKRMQTDVAKRQHQKKVNEQMLGKECTFSPRVNKRSTNIAHRGHDVRSQVQPLFVPALHLPCLEFLPRRTSLCLSECTKTPSAAWRSRRSEKPWLVLPRRQYNLPLPQLRPQNRALLAG